jgi:hypothetical protein
MTARHHLLRCTLRLGLVIGAELCVVATARARAGRPAASGSPAAAVADGTDPETACGGPYDAPFGVGEQLRYTVKVGAIKVGEGRVEVLGRDTVRGREAWHTRFSARGRILLYRVDDTIESWIDAACFQSLRSVQRLDEWGRSRERQIELLPERSAFRENGGPEERSVPRPLDDGAFFFFLRTQDLVVGRTYEYRQYYRPNLNPVTLRVLGRERVTVPAGSFDAIVLQPIMNTDGVFARKRDARIWLTDDRDRVMVKMTSKLAFGSLTMSLTSIRPPVNSSEASQ